MSDMSDTGTSDDYLRARDDEEGAPPGAAGMDAGADTDLDGIGLTGAAGGADGGADAASVDTEHGWHSDHADDTVAGSSMDSFPASDPPSYDAPPRP